MWERTNVTNLLRNRESGTYYARGKVNGKQKGRTLETSVFSLAKSWLADKKRAMRTNGVAKQGESRAAGAEEIVVGHFIGVFRERTKHDTSTRAGYYQSARKEEALTLPTAAQFQAMITNIRSGGSKWSEVCADFARLPSYLPSGAARE